MICTVAMPRASSRYGRTAGGRQITAKARCGCFAAWPFGTCLRSAPAAARPVLSLRHVGPRFSLGDTRHATGADLDDRRVGIEPYRFLAIGAAGRHVLLRRRNARGRISFSLRTDRGLCHDVAGCRSRSAGLARKIAWTAPPACPAPPN
jgi:hypothetical protein